MTAMKVLLAVAILVTLAGGIHATPARSSKTFQSASSKLADLHALIMHGAYAPVCGSLSKPCMEALGEDACCAGLECRSDNSYGWGAFCLPKGLTNGGNDPNLLPSNRYPRNTAISPRNKATSKSQQFSFSIYVKDLLDANAVRQSRGRRRSSQPRRSSNGRNRYTPKYSSEHRYPPEQSYLQGNAGGQSPNIPSPQPPRQCYGWGCPTAPILTTAAWTTRAATTAATSVATTVATAIATTGISGTTGAAAASTTVSGITTASVNATTTAAGAATSINSPQFGCSASATEIRALGNARAVPSTFTSGGAYQVTFLVETCDASIGTFKLADANLLANAICGRLASSGIPNPTCLFTDIAAPLIRMQSNELIMENIPIDRQSSTGARITITILTGPELLSSIILALSNSLRTGIVALLNTARQLPNPNSTTVPATTTAMSSTSPTANTTSTGATSIVATTSGTGSSSTTQTEATTKSASTTRATSSTMSGQVTGASSTTSATTASQGTGSTVATTTTTSAAIATGTSTLATTSTSAAANPTPPPPLSEQQAVAALNSPNFGCAGSSSDAKASSGQQGIPSPGAGLSAFQVPVDVDACTADTSSFTLNDANALALATCARLRAASISNTQCSFSSISDAATARFDSDLFEEELDNLAVAMRQGRRRVRIIIIIIAPASTLTAIIQVLSNPLRGGVNVLINLITPVVAPSISPGN